MSREAGFFLLGVLSPFLMLVAAAVGVLILRAIFEAVGWTFHFRKPATKRASAHAASVIYGAEKSCFFILRNFAITFSLGLDQKRRWEAFELLEPKKTLKVSDDFKKRMKED